ncbi:MAG: PocR ligand-binding domain-containing protein [Magnetospirillum sp.]|nr:PocR ligand-binding domain-containing protein [Magnetospirillum sp.]
MSNERDKPAGEDLFVRPSTVAAMCDPPLNVDWSAALGGQGGDRPPSAGESAQVDLAASIDFSLMNGIFENFLEVVGLPIAIIDLKGLVLASSRWQRLCMDFHRVDARTLARCVESDVSLSRDMAEGKAYAIYRCHNGLTDCAAPIVVEGEHVANLFIGQFFLAPPDPDYFRRQQEEFGFDKDAYAKALAEVPIVAEHKLPAILKLMGGLAQQIARQSLAEQRLRASYATVGKQVAERTRELVASHERLRKIAARVPGVVYQFVQRPDGSTGIPYASDAIGAMFGLSPEDVRDDAAGVFAAAHPDDVDGLVASIRDSAATLAPWRHEFRVRKPDGSIRWLGGDSVPQREDDGTIVWHGFISDITERRRTGMLLEARLRLADYAALHSLHDLLVATLDEACAFTQADVGFYHFLLADQKTLSLQAWSTRTTREFCRADAEPGHYDIAAAGVWADCVRQRRSVVYNDYPLLPHRKGLPEGHAPVRRLISVPIFRDGRIMAIIGVGNKAIDFDRDDLTAVETLADLAWDLIERKRAEETLAEGTELVRRRYESLRALNDIAALPSGGRTHQLVEAITLGARHLALPFGIVARIDGATYTIEHLCAPGGSGLTTGQTFALGDTYCSITLQAEDVVAIPHVGKSSHAGHPCYKALGLEAYIAAPVRVGGEVYGTVNFSSPDPYGRDFDEGDLEFMRLLARWVGSVLERERADAEIVAAKEAAEQRARELASSNSDLEQFAYVASHDLRQPLRMVNSYLALIERRYGDKLDASGHEFIGFARDGALHMDRLILDLLEYSRVGRHGQPDEVVDLAGAVGEALHHLQAASDETGSTLDIAAGPVPVAGNRTELVRLFQNLIGNAIKYRAPDRAPRIEVRWQRRDGEWLVSVKDNGIGIPPEFRQDIFKIFRRLHTSDQYEGTGIGLAVCQKIVKNHGGRIWIESIAGEGCTFFFTIPVAANTPR